MSDQDLKEFLATVKRLREEHSADPGKARAFLIEAGILDEKGELTQPYR